MINRDFDSAESGKFPHKTKKTHRTENAIWETRVLNGLPSTGSDANGKKYPLPRADRLSYANCLNLLSDFSGRIRSFVVKQGRFQSDSA